MSFKPAIDEISVKEGCEYFDNCDWETAEKLYFSSVPENGRENECNPSHLSDIYYCLSFCYGLNNRLNLSEEYILLCLKYNPISIYGLLLKYVELENIMKAVDEENNKINTDIIDMLLNKSTINIIKGIIYNINGDYKKCLYYCDEIDKYIIKINKYKKNYENKLYLKECIDGINTFKMIIKGDTYKYYSHYDNSFPKKSVEIYTELLKNRPYWCRNRIGIGMEWKDPSRFYQMIFSLLPLFRKIPNGIRRYKNPELLNVCKVTNELLIRKQLDFNKKIITDFEKKNNNDMKENETEEYDDNCNSDDDGDVKKDKIVDEIENNKDTTKLLFSTLSLSIRMIYDGIYSKLKEFVDVNEKMIKLERPYRKLPKDIKTIVNLCNKFATMNSCQQKSYLYDRLKRNPNLRTVLLNYIPFGPLVQCTEKYSLNPEHIIKQPIPNNWIKYKNMINNPERFYRLLWNEKYPVEEINMPLVREDMMNIYWDFFGYGAIPTQKGVEILGHKKKVKPPPPPPTPPSPPSPPPARPTSPIPKLTFITYPIESSLYSLEDEWNRIPNTYKSRHKEIEDLLYHINNDEVTSFDDVNRLRELMGFEEMDFESNIKNKRDGTIVQSPYKFAHVSNEIIPMKEHAKRKIGYGVRLINVPKPMFYNDNVGEGDDEENDDDDDIYQFKELRNNIIPYINRTYSPIEIKRRHNLKSFKPTRAKEPKLGIRTKSYIPSDLEIELAKEYELYSDPISVALRNSVKPKEPKKKVKRRVDPFPNSHRYIRDFYDIPSDQSYQTKTMTISIKKQTRSDLILGRKIQQNRNMK